MLANVNIDVMVMFWPMVTGIFSAGYISSWIPKLIINPDTVWVIDSSMDSVLVCITVG